MRIRRLLILIVLALPAMTAVAGARVIAHGSTKLAVVQAIFQHYHSDTIGAKEYACLQVDQSTAQGDSDWATMSLPGTAPGCAGAGYVADGFSVAHRVHDRWQWQGFVGQGYFSCRGVPKPVITDLSIHCGNI